jgi:CRP-like cAMP-binding protein
MITTKALLSSTDPFNAFDEIIIDRFLAEAGDSRFVAGETTFAELSTGDEVYFIIDCDLRISVELASAFHKGESIDIGPGTLVGEVRFIDDGPRPATVTALSDVRASAAIGPDR